MRSVKILSLAVAGAVALTALTATGTPASAATSGGTVLKTATLPDIPLARFSNSLLPGSVTNDRNVDLGGIGSDLYPTGVPGEFWAITDRGPNGQIKVDGKNRRTFPVPSFDPAIVRIRVKGSTIQVIKAIPITNRHGKGVTGLPNQKTHDEAPYDYAAATPLNYDPEGLDTEGIVRAKDGSFWLADEYGPSLVHVSPSGKVLARYVPKGLGLTGTDYPVVESLPAIFAKRKINRGFEGLGLLPGGDLVIVLQSPLSNPDGDAGDASRTTRLVRFSTHARKVVAEYAYGFDAVSTVDPSEDDPSALKSSAVIGIDNHTVLVEERTDNAARLYRIDLRKATNILGSKWDDPATSPSLEEATGVPVPPKKLVIDLGATPGVPKKIEGIALVDRKTIAIVNDNDFGMTDGAAAFDANGNLVDSGIQTQLQYVRLP
ncbi:esterase-like activity of phytase family protein [Cryptosporangium phraense]|uniref:Esterase-like activity of phytase family protein n=1 Tax=Cryptosporangium phraense TaxID=2593070 RepID=A0A545AWA0_9ACTN|nr:esterase-like activity of phytase family protein [Cryptosporangium phraense]